MKFSGDLTIDGTGVKTDLTVTTDDAEVEQIRAHFAEVVPALAEVRNIRLRDGHLRLDFEHPSFGKVDAELTLAAENG